MTMGLSKEDIKIISQAVDDHFERREKRKQKERRDWRLRNTKLLLEKYRFLKAHCEDIPIEIEELETTTIFDIKDLTLETLLEHKAKSFKLLRYLDGIIMAYQNLCKVSNEAAKRRCKAIEKFYLEDAMVSQQKLAKELHIDRTTLGRDLERAIEELSIMLFGVDAILG